MKTPLALLALLLAAAPALAQRVVYVKQNAAGAGDGTSWHDAYRELRTALPATVAGDEVWVARATYKPTPGTDREATFHLRSGVAVYGGFTGTETQRDERDWALNETILSGDVGVGGNHADNSYHVVLAEQVDSTAVLDGFTITRGRANGSPMPSRRGGGVYVVGGNPVIRNCTFHLNEAVGGGGLYGYDGARPTIADCLFLENVSYSGGGGVANEASSPHLERVVFRGNTAARVCHGLPFSSGIARASMRQTKAAQCSPASVSGSRS